MKVKTLIEKLSRFNPDAEVRLNDSHGELALFVNAKMNDKSLVWIDGANDIDMGSEISARFEALDECRVSESDFVTDMMEIGISVDMVRKYVGENKKYLIP